MKWLFLFPTTFVISLTILNPWAFAQESSPAQGGWLSLRDAGSFSFAEVLNNPSLNGMEEIAIEAWVYVRELPAMWNIVEKRGAYSLAIQQIAGIQGLLKAGLAFNMLIFPVDTLGSDLQLDGWNHIGGAFSVEDSELWIYLNGKAERLKNAPPRQLVSNSPLRVAGFPDGVERGIDELRISSIIRYKGDYQPPEEPLEADEETIALWHFEDGRDAKVLRDASGNRNNLIPQGAGIRLAGKPILPYQVRHLGRSMLTATWGQIKQHSWTR